MEWTVYFSFGAKRLVKSKESQGPTTPAATVVDAIGAALPGVEIQQEAPVPFDVKVPETVAMFDYKQRVPHRAAWQGEGFTISVAFSAYDGMVDMVGVTASDGEAGFETVGRVAEALHEKALDSQEAEYVDFTLGWSGWQDKCEQLAARDPFDAMLETLVEDMDDEDDDEDEEVEEDDGPPPLIVDDPDTARHLKIKVAEVDEPIADPVTKFGGQPAWLSEPQWPINKLTGNPLRFICQVALDPALFPGAEGRVAYVFYSDEEASRRPWDADSGENAVIIQPDGQPTVEVQPLTEGPTIYKMVKSGSSDRLVEQPCECAATLEPGEERPFVPDSLQYEDDFDTEDYFDHVEQGSKIGGTPVFIQSDEFPTKNERWRLIIQIDSQDVPFCINFGDCGKGYAFLREDAQVGAFLWQC